MIFIGIPEFQENGATAFIRKTNKLFRYTGTTALLKASSHFKELSVSPDPIKNKQASMGIGLVVLDELEQPKIKFPKKEALAEQLIGFHSLQTIMINDFYKNNILPFFQQYDDIVYSLEKIINEAFANIDKNAKVLSKANGSKLFSQITVNFLVKSKKLIKEKKKENTKQQVEEIRKGIRFFINELIRHFKTIPESVDIQLFANDLVTEKDDTWDVSLFKSLKRNFNSKKKIQKGIAYQAKANVLIRSEYEQDILESLLDIEKNLGVFSFKFILELQNLVTSIYTQLVSIPKSLSEEKISPKFIAIEKENANVLIGQLKSLLTNTHRAIYKNLIFRLSESIETISVEFDKTPVNKYIRKVKQKQLDQLLPQIYDAPNKWSYNQQLLFNGVDIEVQILLLKLRLGNIVSETNKEIKAVVFESLINEIAQKEDSINKFHADNDNSSNNDGFQSEPLTYQEKNARDRFNKISGRMFRKIELIINKLPSTLNLMDKEILNDLKDLQFTAFDTLELSVSRHIDLYIQKILTGPFQKNIDDLPENITAVTISINDNLRLLQATSNKQDELILNQEVFDGSEDYSGFLIKQTEKIADQRQTIEKLSVQVETDLMESLKTIDDVLTLPYLLKTKDSLQQFVYKREVDKKLSIIHKTTGKLDSFAQGLKEQFWYKQSKALLFARKITSEKKHTSTVNDLLLLKEIISPSPEISKTLPFYYKQLFLNTQNHQEGFWYGRNSELANLEKAIQWYKEGRSGGILITGDRKSGKTFLSQYSVSKFLPGYSSFVISPPQGGSIDPNDLLSVLQSATGIKSGKKTIFKKLPNDSVVIIDDLELWWEKSENGNRVVSEIVGLIKTYSQRCLFIVNINQHSYGIINEINKIDNCFLNIVECGPFDAESLKEIILFRHRSGGLGLHFGDKANKLTPSVLAGIITKYFNYSKGNVGVALQQWIANITSVKDDTLFIKTPQNPDVSVLDYLDTETNIYLSQFILHDQLSHSKLERITGDNKDEIHEKLMFLKRTGLIDELPDGIYEINRYTYHHILNKLQSKDFI